MFNPYAYNFEDINLNHSDLVLDFNDSLFNEISFPQTLLLSNAFLGPQSLDIGGLGNSSAILNLESSLVDFIAQAAISASIDNGHIYTSDEAGCACCGHDHGFNAKAQIIALTETLQSALDSGLVTLTVDQLIDFAASNQGVDSQMVKDSFKDIVEISSAEGGDTTLYMDSVAGDSSTTATLSIGGRVSGTRETSTDADWYQVDLVDGQQYTFIMLRDGANPHADPLMQLIGTDGTTIEATNDDIAAGTTNSRIIYTATETGTFYISAEGWSTTTGDYTIFAELDNERPDFTLDESAFFLTDQFSPGAQWGTTNLTYDVSALPAGAQTLAILAMDAWAAVSGLTFTAVTGGATASITYQDTESGAYASTSTSGGVITSSTINISSTWSGGNLDLDSYTYQTYLHEVGHALGLGHGGTYNGSANHDTDRIYDTDAWNYTVMSYFDQDEASTGNTRLALGLEIVDIIAIQSLYGVNASGTLTGDTTFGFNVTADVLDTVYDFENTFDDNGDRPPSLSIYDTGGTDTLDFSGYDTNQTISLVQETFSTIGYNPFTAATDDALENLISIARGSDIENATSGGGDDVLIGNDLANILSGGAGEDNLNGGAGNDRLFGNDGNDVLIGGANNDFLFGGVGNDDLFGGDQTDRLFGSDGNDLLVGGGNNDIMYGGGNVDRLYGGLGNDTMNGGSNVDFLYGGENRDTLYGGNAPDQIDGGAGNDTLWGGNRGSGFDGSKDTFIFENDFGSDVIKDFEDGIDLIDFSGHSNFNSFADVLANASDDGTNLTIALNGSNTIFIENFVLTDLDASDFVF